MEHIKSALKKAGVLDETNAPAAPVSNAEIKPPIKKVEIAAKSSDLEVPELRKIEIDPKHLERRRIVSKSMDDPNYIAFNLLRTRIRQAMSDNNWKSLAITSPTPGCGKTMVTLNLAFSLSRNPGLRTVVVDLDLRRPSVAPTLNIEPDRSIAQFLLGKAEAKDCFVQVDPNLVLGLNSGHTPASSELLQAPKMLELFEFIETTLSPEIILFDLPPMRSSDDALGFLPRIDTSLLVVASGTSTTAEVDECELHISELDKLLGIVLNKCEDTQSEDYYY
ncbi:CpsD/CapB family tyrosine-protein kinase [uncultured Roseibium sp.]|uniref:CpsD/CapB family tyrosine-protein kinase n=1 Tax=uncultured Roseibium sp. TaxID=1936171 RepID=UPI00261F1390|nr:CpsD/CapB family tyrosine-protein kinase [uncultured Roseibium sp.]